MATTKTFKTSFEIGAKYTGKAAFDKLRRDLADIKANTANTARKIGTMFTAMKTGIVAIATSRIARQFYDVGAQAIEAAEEVRNATDQVRQNYALMIKEGRLSAKDLNKVTQEAFELAESLKGIDAEDMAVSLSKLSRWLSDKQIRKLAKGYQDYLITINKGIPTQEGFATAEAKIQAWVKSGRGMILKELGWSQDRINSYKKSLKGLSDYDKEQERAKLLTKELGVETGAMDKFWESDKGAAYANQQSHEAWNEAAGKTAAAAIPELNRALGEMWVALKPIADLIDQNLNVNIQNMTKWLRENKDEIKAWSEKVKDAWDGLIAAQDRSQAFFKPYLDATKDFFKNLWTNTVKEFNELWPILSQFFKDLWANTEKEFAELWPILSKFGEDLWTNTLKEWETIKKIVPWIGENIIMPIYNWFTWLKDEIIKVWELIKPIWDKMMGLWNQQGNLPPGQGGEAWRRAQEGRARAGGGEGTTGSAGEGATTGATSNPGLAAARAAFIEEMNDPEKRARLYARAKGEVGYQGPEAIQKEMETIFNRAWSRKQTVDETVRQGGKAGNYWGSKYKPVSAQEAKVYDMALSGIKAGSDLSNLATGNESANLRNGQVVSTARGGERFVIEPNDVRRQRELQKIRDTAKPTSSLRNNVKGMNARPGSQQGQYGINVAGINPTININGSAGDPNVVGQKVVGAMRQSTRETIAEMNRARNFQNRTGYV